MKTTFASLVRRALPRALHQSEGQILPIMVLFSLVLMAMLGFAADVGNAYWSYHELQSSSDAAALAGAWALPSSTAASVATAYSSVSGGKNVYANLGTVTMSPGFPLIRCLATLQNQGEACASPALGNAITVKQQADVPMWFAKLIGFKTIHISASSTAAMRGSKPKPYNVAIVLDTSLSMNSYDSDCSATRIACALTGVQQLLQNLTPCAITISTCNVTNGVADSSIDKVSLFTFPNVSTATSSVDTNCTTPIPSPTYQNGYHYSSSFGNYSMLPSTAWSGVPSALPYSFPSATGTTYAPTANSSTTGTYQLTNFVSDYRSSSRSSTLTSTSSLVMTAGGKSGCGSMLPPNYDGNYGTYIAGAIYAAQAALTAAQAANPGSQNAMIILSDGDSTAPQSANGITIMPSPATGNGHYPSWVNECGQAIVAAKGATAAGTKVYTVAYGSGSSGCNTDTNNALGYQYVTPCQTMEYMASAPQFFFSDYNQSGSPSSCQSAAQPTANLSQIFVQIANNLTAARLIPDGTT